MRLIILKLVVEDFIRICFYLHINFYKTFYFTCLRFKIASCLADMRIHSKR